MFTKLFETENKTQAPRTARVALLSDANVEQVTGGISGKVPGNTAPQVDGYGGSGGGTGG